ncbi:hypothetical protein EHYA_08344 [Embleya hyalina]|uniref:Uncharacterized protein n=1 Tax=Embleya hyalina TaxID=516124 RepID=A0A401Z1A5_9ACTN|nr:hypothetical protein EHYA_08344 [Embleya hyalina]
MDLVGLLAATLGPAVGRAEQVGARRRGERVHQTVVVVFVVRDLGCEMFVGDATRDEVVGIGRGEPALHGHRVLPGKAVGVRRAV